MTPHEAHAAMRRIRQEFGDEAQSKATELLCKLMRQAGYAKAVDEFEKIK